MHTSHPHRQNLASETPDIIVYPHRRRTMLWLFLGSLSSLILFLLIPILMIFIPASRNIDTIFAACLIGGFGLASLWPTWTIARILLSKDPMLMITHQGIHIGKLYSSADIVLPWREIEMISMLSNGLAIQLLICPKDIPSFLSRFNLSMRFFLRLNLLNGAPIAIAQSFLEKPIEEILYQLQAFYSAELDHYHVQLWQ